MSKKSATKRWSSDEGMTIMPPRTARRCSFEDCIQWDASIGTRCSLMPNGIADPEKECPFYVERTEV